LNFVRWYFYFAYVVTFKRYHNYSNCNFLLQVLSLCIVNSAILIFWAGLLNWGHKLAASASHPRKRYFCVASKWYSLVTSFLFHHLSIFTQKYSSCCRCGERLKTYKG